MKAMFRNYFKGGKLYQWDELMNIYSISNTDIKHEFCLDQEGMQNLMKFENPIIQVGKTLKVIGNKLTANIKLVDCEFIVPTMEFDIKNKKILQLYGDHDSKPAQELIDAINNNWLAKAKRILNKECVKL